MSINSHISSDSNGRHVVAGTEIEVSTIVKYAENGASMAQLRQIFPRLTEDDIRAAIAYSLPSPFKQFVHEQAFLVAAIVFAVVGLSVAALGGFGLSIRLGNSGWPIILAMTPIFVPAGAVAIATFVLIRRF